MICRSRPRHPGWIPLVAVVLLLSGGAALGATPSFDIERFQAAPDSSGGFAVPSPARLSLGQFALSLTLDDEIAPLVLQTDTGSQRLVSNRLGGTLGAVVGIGAGFAIGVSIPAVLYQAGSEAGLAELVRPGGVSAAALGTLTLAPRVTLLDEARHWLDLALEAGVTIPTGSGSAYASDSGVGGLANVILGRSIGPLRLVIEAGVRLRQNETVGRVPVGDELPLRGALVYTLPRVEGGFVPAQLVGELDGSVFLGKSSAAAQTNPGEWRVGIRFCLGHVIALTAGGGGGLSDAYGTPAARFLVSAGYDARVCATPSDRDHDGIPDSEDACPDRPGDVAHHGCPSVDTDHDGIPDSEDRCPTVPGDRAHAGCPAPKDTDHDGIPDSEDRCPTVPGDRAHAGCPAASTPKDTDGDGIPDALDKCPTEPGPIEFGGCPPPDRDHDGVADFLDECPDEPGPVSNNGCPIKDSDHDGIPDDQDRCPDDPGDAAHAGCPFHDADGDGVPDELDNCPNERGTASNFGCTTKQLVELADDRIIVLERIRFAGDSSQIDRASLKVLDNVVAVLKVHPEITHLRVEGHLDNRGDSHASLTLSQARADRVAAYLISHGVTDDRIDSVGYGGDQPVASNLTETGREANRRIEFVITGRARKIFIKPIIDRSGETHYVPGPVPEPKASPAPRPAPAPKAPEKPKSDDLPLPDDLSLPPTTPAPPPPQKSPKGKPDDKPGGNFQDLPPIEDTPPPGR
jgi:outer membrane protein OmpA-like peptidoglycan-associated protein